MQTHFSRLYGPFAIKREETDRKKIFELMPILDIFHPKNHIWHINVTLIFFGSFPPFYCKGPICSQSICSPHSSHSSHSKLFICTLLCNVQTTSPFILIYI